MKDYDVLAVRAVKDRTLLCVEWPYWQLCPCLRGRVTAHILAACCFHSGRRLVMEWQQGGDGSVAER